VSVDPAEDRGVFLFPGQKGVVFWYSFWFIPKYTKHPEEAKRFFKFLMSEGQVIRVKGGGRLSAYTRISPEDYPAPEREVFKVIKGKEVVPDMDDTIGSAEVTLGAS